MTVSPDDERPHAPGVELSWVETTWLELYDPGSELAGAIRLDVRPNQGASEVSFSFFLSDDGFVTARRVTPQLTGTSSVVALEDARLETLEPLRRWTVSYDGPSHSLASAADAGKRDAWHRSRLERLIVELDVTATQDAVSGRGSFSQPVRVSGEVWVSGDQYVLAARGLRGKSWGSGAPLQSASRVALVFGDDRAVFAHVASPAGEGGVPGVVEGWTSVGGDVRPVQALRVEHRPGAGGTAPAVTIVVQDDRGVHHIAAELPHLAPMPVLHGARTGEMRLAVAHARWDGCHGHGFVEELD